MTAWNAYLQYAALRSRAILAQRELLQPSPCSEDDTPTRLDTRPYLLVASFNGPLHYWLDQKASWRIGRSPDCEITIADQWISRCHATLQSMSPTEFYLVDLQSYNGSFINERRIRTVAKLEHGDRIRLGRTEFEFYLNASTSPMLECLMNSGAVAAPASQSNTPVAL
jgi:pSer/pThr/pTyr-binding forkhead associated (FHA) protein